MKFVETEIPGVLVVSPDVFRDERGEFVINWMPDEFAARGLETTIAQTSGALTLERGSIRGLHYQAAPFEEAKVVRVTRGGVFDVAVDLRPDSPTYLKWVGAELTASNRQIMYIPKGCAHGYQTLVDDTTLLYAISAPYDAASARGVRWNDPALAIPWPEQKAVHLSDRDRSLPLLAELPAEF